jgi:hypothetical protein
MGTEIEGGEFHATNLGTLPARDHNFWLVWSPNGNLVGAERYRCEIEAIVEARRLARLNPGQKFYWIAAHDFAEEPVAKRTMVSIYANGKRNTVFCMLPLIDGRVVLTAEMLNAELKKLGVEAGDTYSVGF